MIHVAAVVHLSAENRAVEETGTAGLWRTNLGVPQGALPGPTTRDRYDFTRKTGQKIFFLTVISERQKK